MRESLAELLTCPNGCEDRLRLSVESWQRDRIQTGAIFCEGCGRSYPIYNAIPRMLPAGLNEINSADDETLARKQSEMQARDEQADEYDRMWHLTLFGLVEIPATILPLDLQPDHLVLEAGCGTGRMTREFARRCRKVVSVDYSGKSLRRNVTKLARSGVENVDLIQADICHLPFRSKVFDRAVSCQVLEHIPSPGSRTEAVSELSRTLKPGGNLVLSAYQYSLLTRLFGQKEGEHAGGIYFYRFDREELRALLSQSFTVDGMSGALVYHYIARCRKTEATV